MATRTWQGTDGSNPTKWDVAANWVEGSIPVTGDDVYFPYGNTVSVTTGLAQSAVLLSTFTIDPGYTGQIGGTAAASYLHIGASTFGIPLPTQLPANGSTMIRVDTGTNACAATLATGSRTTYAVNLLGAALTLVVSGGSVSVAAAGGETATVASLRLVTNNVGPTPSVLLGGGCTATAINATAGTIVNRSNQAMPAVQVSGSGIYDYQGTGAHSGTFQVDPGATCYYSGIGALTATSPAVSGTLDFSRDQRAKTITHPVNLYAAASLIADSRYVSMTAGANLNFCGMPNLGTFDLGTNILLNVTAL